MQQNILEKHPNAKVAVYAAWLPMLATDARSEWDASLLDDPRVRHFWDEERTAGRWFAEADLKADRFGPIVWDAYLLFGPNSRWDDEQTALLGSGSPIIGATDALEGELAPFLQRG